MRSPLFVVGTQRSGTTLLCAILNQHRSYYVTNELPYGTYDLLANQSTQALAEHLRLDSRFPGDPSMAAASCASGWEYLETAMSRQATHFTRDAWGIKDPQLTDHLEMFARRYPDARFIIIIRDPRSVVSSLMKNSWHVANVLHGAQGWCQEVLKQLAFAEAHPTVATVVQYKDLVTEPKGTIAGICRELSIDFVPEMLTRPNTTDIKLNKLNENAFKDIQRNFDDKWKTHFTPRQVQILESVAGPLMQRLGYSLQSEPTPLARITTLWYTLHQRIASELRWQCVRRVVPAWNRMLGLIRPVGRDARHIGTTP